LALAYGNPFNGVIFALLAMTLVALSLRLGREPVGPGGAWSSVAGAAMIVLGWTYPHFLDSSRPALAYLYGAPTALVPCPTLALIIGFGLLADGLGSRAWSLTLAIAGLCYGIFGVLRLGVWLDFPLLLGAAALLGLSLMRR